MNGTAERGVAQRKQVAKLTYTHEAMVDLILQEPTVTPEELGELFGFSTNWVRSILKSDSFQVRLEDRRAALVDPTLQKVLNNRLREVAIKSVDILNQRLTANQSAELALEALGIASNALAPRVAHGKTGSPS